MKQKWMICLALASSLHAIAWGQNALPQKDCLAIGGGIMTGVGQGSSDFMDKAGKPLCYTVGSDYRHYLVPAFAVGATYEFITSKQGENKLRCHYIAPTLTLRFLMDEDKHGVLFTLGGGYFHYADRVHHSQRVKSTFNKGYFGLSADIGYEFTISKKTSMLVKASFLMADWHSNPDYQPKFMRNDPDEYQSMFESSLMYASLGISLQFGK